LLVLCRDYANSVRPHGHKQDSNSDKDGSSFDHSAHHKKVKQWFMNPVKFRAEMEAGQDKNPGKCLYHLTKPHPTCDCYIKKECDKLLATKRSNGSNTCSNTTQSGTNGQLRNITELVDDDTPVSEDNIIDTMLDSNDTNEEELFYFMRLKNHYLRLVDIQWITLLLWIVVLTTTCSERKSFLLPWFLHKARWYLEMVKLPWIYMVLVKSSV